MLQTSLWVIIQRSYDGLQDTLDLTSGWPSGLISHWSLNPRLINPTFCPWNTGSKPGAFTCAIPYAFLSDISIVCEGDQNKLHSNMPILYKNYFELKATKKQQIQDKLSFSPFSTNAGYKFSFYWKQPLTVQRMHQRNLQNKLFSISFLSCIYLPTFRPALET